VNEALDIDAEGIELPPITEIPEAEIKAEPVGEPVGDSEGDWLTETRRLQEQVAYAEVG
jgi:hypothetical protein